jgi:hypothetical protein
MPSRQQIAREDIATAVLQDCNCLVSHEAIPSVMKHTKYRSVNSKYCISTPPYDRLCGLVVRVPGYTTEMYCVSCEVRTEFIYVM